MFNFKIHKQLEGCAETRYSKGCGNYVFSYEFCNVEKVYVKNFNNIFFNRKLSVAASVKLASKKNSKNDKRIGLLFDFQVGCTIFCSLNNLLPDSFMNLKILTNGAIYLALCLFGTLFIWHSIYLALCLFKCHESR